MSQTQQSQRFEMPSGAVLMVTVAPFTDAWSLMKASLKTLKGMELKSEDLKKEMNTLMSSPSTISSIMDRIVEFATSSEVEAATWKCAQRALYIPANSDPIFPGWKVDHNLFDNPDHGNSAREDYAKIVTAILEVNCKPFLVSALSGFLKPKATIPESQLQKSV